VVVAIRNGYGPVRHVDSDGPESADWLEVERWMPWILAKKSEGAVGSLPNFPG